MPKVAASTAIVSATPKGVKAVQAAGGAMLVCGLGLAVAILCGAGESSLPVNARAVLLVAGAAAAASRLTAYAGARFTAWWIAGAVLLAVVSRPLPAEEPLGPTPTKAEYLAWAKKRAAVRARQLDQQAKDIRSGKLPLPPGQSKKAALSSIMQEKAALAASFDPNGKFRLAVGGLGDPRESRLGRLWEVLRIIDGNTMIVRFWTTAAGGDDRELLIHGMPTSGLSDNAKIEAAPFVAVTGTETDDSGTTRLIIQAFTR